MKQLSYALILLLAMPALANEMVLKARQTVDIYGSSTLDPRLADVDYQLSWKLSGVHTDDGCRPSQVQVSLTATVTEPLTWPQTPDWQNYRLALTGYERLVRERALLSAQWLEASLFHISTQDSCQKLQEVADNVGYHQLNIARTLLRDFQQKNDYGRRLGLLRPTP
ncbi:MAG: DUF922 domain-containing protein [Oceanisphaera sp.]|uniref:DUF922 domain-containing protein n=1 Tax=Oceanisphaera sp. TaxID=1929979 RepID=UPI003F998505